MQLHSSLATLTPSQVKCYQAYATHAYKHTTYSTFVWCGVANALSNSTVHQPPIAQSLIIYFTNTSLVSKALQYYNESNLGTMQKKGNEMCSGECCSLTPYFLYPVLLTTPSFLEVHPPQFMTLLPSLLPAEYSVQYTVVQLQQCLLLTALLSCPLRWLTDQENKVCQFLQK